MQVEVKNNTLLSTELIRQLAVANQSAIEC